VTNHASNSADSVPRSEARPKPLGRAEHDTAHAFARAMKVSGVTCVDVGAALGVCETVARKFCSVVAPRVLRLPLPLRRQLAAELLHDHAAAPAAADLGSGLRVATHRLGLAASVVELALSPFGPGGSEVTKEERAEVLRVCASVRGAIEAIEAWARRGA
jgi:hypothetical protein